MTDDTLKPCPWCAKPGEHNHSHGWHGIGCATPKCNGYRHALQHRTEAEAVAAWNRRELTGRDA